MKKLYSKRGFTLIELLVVIAIIAVLIAIILPVATETVKKAKAATDAANLRSCQAELNIQLFDGESDTEKVKAIISAYEPTSPAYDEDAVMMVYYDYPAAYEIYYVSGDIYYSIAYFSELASNSEPTVSTANPHPNDPTHWYTVGASN